MQRLGSLVGWLLSWNASNVPGRAVPNAEPVPDDQYLRANSSPSWLHLISSPRSQPQCWYVLGGRRHFCSWCSVCEPLQGVTCGGLYSMTLCGSIYRLRSPKCWGAVPCQSKVGLCCFWGWAPFAFPGVLMSESEHAMVVYRQLSATELIRSNWDIK